MNEPIEYPEDVAILRDQLPWGDPALISDQEIQRLWEVWSRGRFGSWLVLQPCYTAGDILDAIQIGESSARRTVTEHE